MVGHQHHSHGKAPDLSPNESRILSCLRKAKEPMSAYAILDEVRPSGISHPPTVYRALAALEALGMVHKLKSMSAFVACDEGCCGGRFAFAFCRNCQKVFEIGLDEGRYEALLALTPKGFAADQVSLELTGTCRGCQAAA